MNDEHDMHEQGLPSGLTDDIAALAAVMAEHGLGKIEVDANGVHVVLSAPRTQKPGASANGTFGAFESAETSDERLYRFLPDDRHLLFSARSRRGAIRPCR